VPAKPSSAPVLVIWPLRTLDAGGRRSPRDPSPLHRLHESPIAMSSRGLRGATASTSRPSHLRDPSAPRHASFSYTRSTPRSQTTSAAEIVKWATQGSNLRPATQEKPRWALLRRTWKRSTATERRGRLRAHGPNRLFEGHLLQCPRPVVPTQYHLKALSPPAATNVSIHALELGLLEVLQAGINELRRPGSTTTVARPSAWSCPR
jgi:hypothetical protein